MPPKKETKKDVVQKEDNSGMPKNDVQFKFEFEIKHNNVQNIVLMWEWFSQNSSTTERYDAQLIENWTPKEATDPTTLVFTRDFDPLRVDDDFCKLITQKEFYLYFVNAEDSKIKQEILFDFSSLLSSSSETPKFSFENNKMMIMEIEDFKFSVTADKPLLLPLYKHFLNPLEIEVIGAKDVPVASDKPYEPCYVQYSFFDGYTVKTPSRLQKSTIKWGAKHVFLCGLLDQVSIVEKIGSQFLKMEVHDKDEKLDNKLKQELPLVNIQTKIQEIIDKNKPPEEEIDPKTKKGGKGAPPPKKEPPKKEPPKKDAKKDTKKKGGEVKVDPIKDVPEGPPIEYLRNNYGVACFFLTDLLKPSVRNVKLRVPIVPLKKYEDLESKNLDLNTTAKKSIPAIAANSNFFDQNSFLVISLNLAHPFGTFKMPDKPIESIVEEAPASKKGKAPAPPPPSKKEAPKPVEKKIEKIDFPPIFERAVYYMPYKSPEFVKKLQDTFYAINMEAAKIEAGGVRAITTKKLTEEERKNRELDFLGGFEIIDSKFRLFVIEGLAKGAMKRLEEEIPRSEPNSEDFKILKNSDALFQERAYLDFNMELKRIKLRDNLDSILMKPDIYIRTKEPENICRTLNQISEIPKCWNIKNVAMFDLFPVMENLVAMERKYSDSLSSEDVYGSPQEVKKPKKSKKISSFVDTSKESKTNVTISTMTQLAKVDNFVGGASLDKRTQIQSPSSQELSNKSFSPTKETNKETTKSKRLLHSAKPKQDPQINTIRVKSAIPIKQGEQVYMYGQQRENWFEKQLQEQREQIRKDKNNFYTYSEQYLSLSIDPFNEEQEAKLAILKEKAILAQKQEFRTLPPKTIEERNGHPKKPPLSKIDEISKYPYFKQREREQNTLKSTRGEPIVDKQDFNPNIFPVEFFSQPQVLEVEKITPVERQRQEKEKRKKEIEDWESKLKGQKYLYTKQKVQEHPAQVDKLKNLREDPAVKKGLLLKNTKLKETSLLMERQIRDLPSSMFTKDKYKEKTNILERLLEPDKCVSPFDFDIYQNPEILTKTSVARPLKLDPMYK